MVSFCRLVAEFAKQNKLPEVLVQPLTPLPGIKLFRKLKMEGRILHNHWEDYNGKVVCKPKELTAAELQREVYNCYRRVYSPLQVIKFLLFGKKGFKLIILGIAKLRYLEWLRNKNYIKDKLSN